LASDHRRNRAASASPTLTQILCAAVMVAILWAALPAPIPQPATGPINELCLSLGDTLPANPASAEALQTLERCSTLLPEDAELNAALGVAYESVHNFARAESAYQRALAIDPSYADVRLRLGHLMLRRGATEAAGQQARAALRVQPNRQALLDLLEQSAGARP
jgi:tetratricopeptide (TPR) repeat protein